MQSAKSAFEDLNMALHNYFWVDIDVEEPPILVSTHQVAHITSQQIHVRMPGIFEGPPYFECCDGALLLRHLTHVEASEVEKFMDHIEKIIKDADGFSIEVL